MEQSRFEKLIVSASQEIPRHLLNPKIYHHFKKCHHSSLSWSRCIQFKYVKSVQFRSPV